jgi:hypothetical protein
MGSANDSLTVRMKLAEAFETAGFQPILCATLEAARAARRFIQQSVGLLKVCVIKVWSVASGDGTPGSVLVYQLAVTNGGTRDARICIEAHRTSGVATTATQVLDGGCPHRHREAPT